MVGNSVRRKIFRRIDTALKSRGLFSRFWRLDRGDNLDLQDRIY